MLREGAAAASERYSQARLNMRRKAFDRLARVADERPRDFGALPAGWGSCGTVLVRFGGTERQFDALER